MEIDARLRRHLRDEITVWDAERLRAMPREEFALFASLIDLMGQRSAAAQGLGAPITSAHALLGSDQRLYASTSGGTMTGILKVGRKRLFLRVSSEHDGLVDATLLCVLDIYVEPALQRAGIGRRLFEAFLARERVQPWELAYDRPSPKLQAFLRKHYALCEYIPQANNYMVFTKYFREHRIATALPAVSTPPLQLPQPSLAQQQQQQQQHPSTPGRSPAVTLPSTPPSRSPQSTHPATATAAALSPGSWPWGSPDLPQQSRRSSSSHLAWP